MLTKETIGKLEQLEALRKDIAKRIEEETGGKYVFAETTRMLLSARNVAHNDPFKMPVLTPQELAEDLGAISVTNYHRFNGNVHYYYTIGTAPCVTIALPPEEDDACEAEAGKEV